MLCHYQSQSSCYQIHIQIPCNGVNRLWNTHSYIAPKWKGFWIRTSPSVSLNNWLSVLHFLEIKLNHLLPTDALLKIYVFKYTKRHSFRPPDSHPYTSVTLIMPLPSEVIKRGCTSVGPCSLKWNIETFILLVRKSLLCTLSSLTPYFVTVL